MDFILLILGVICILRHKISSVLTIIVVLGSQYLQIPVSDEFFVNFLFPHEVEDVAIILALFLACFLLRTRVPVNYSFLRKEVIYFYIFLLLSGILDILHGIIFGDVVRQWRHWFFLLIVFVAPLFSFNEIEQSLKQLFKITLVTSIYILLIRFYQIDFVKINAYEVDRGVKPASYSMLFAFLCYVNPWNFSNVKKIVYFSIFIIPIILNLKLTYLITVALSIGLYVAIESVNLSKKLFLGGVVVLFSVFLFQFNEKIANRVNVMSENVKVISEDTNEHDNFTFRLLLAQERLNYILDDPEKMIRGIGFVSEQNYKENPFSIGLYDRKFGKIRQLDTGDIAWAIFFCRLGLGGLLLFLLFYYKLSRAFWKSRQQNKLYSFYFVSLIVFLFFTSFGNTIIAMDDFYIYPILLVYQIVMKEKENLLRTIKN